MTHFEIRKAFLDFFKEREHKILPSSSLIPQNDPSLLFVNAGMNQFKSVILGLEKPPAKNVVTIQKCMRAGGKHNDLENVGQTFRHNTFFEMMGNFSFGGYFKQQAIALAWELFTEKLKIDPEYLWISVYEKDEESYELWRNNQGISENKIYRMGEEDNFWKMGETGPCGPCTEIHYYRGKEKRPDPDQLMEFGNLVFMEFDDKGKGQREKLSAPCVDTGMGLERVSAILQNKQSIYHTDCFKGIIQSLEEASGCKYDFTEKSQSEKQMAFRVIADHSRAAAFLMSDGVLPGNEGQSYVLRRILRRAFYYSHKLNPKVNLLEKGTETLISLMKKVYPELEHEANLVNSTIEKEVNQFSENLHLGQKILFKTGMWTYLHELKVLHIYKRIQNGEKKAQLCEALSKDSDFIQAKISENSIKLKVSNFEFLDKGTGLRNASNRSRDIFKKYSSFSIEELQAEIEKSQDKKIVDSSVVWNLYSTYGFPFDLTRLIAEERGYQVNLEEVEAIKKEQNRGAWTDLHELKVLHIYKRIQNGKKKVQLCEALSKDSDFIQAKISESSIKMKMRNFEFLDKGTGLQNASKRSRDIFKKYSSFSIEELQAVIDKTQAVQHYSQTKNFQPTKFTGYKNQEERGEILSLWPFADGRVEKPEARPIPLKQGESGFVITDKTCFYPEGGGPIGDRGTLKTETGKAEVLDCQKNGDFIFHKVKVIEGELAKGQSCEMKVDADHRRLIKTGHSATHLLHQALRKELGSAIQQAGSLVEPGKLRFDFKPSKSLNEDQIKKIENQVQKNIQSKHSVSDVDQSYQEAEQSGALFLKGENYPPKVRVITMGDSREFCGGIHVKNTSDIGCFKIISETGVQSGVRRITAYTSDIADNWLDSLAWQNFNLRKYLQNRIGSQDEQEKSGSKATPFATINKNQDSNFVKLDQAGGDNLSDATEDAASSPPPIEKINPFISWIKAQDEEIKRLKNQLKNLIPPEKRTRDQSKIFQSEQSVSFFLKDEDYNEWIKQNPKHRDLLAEQILELRKYLKLPAPKDVGLSTEKDRDPKEESPFIPLMESKREEIQSLKNQLEALPWDRFSAEKLKEQAKPFQKEEMKGSLLVINLQVTDRKVLADMADQLKLKISSGVVVLLGEGKESCPLMVTVTKNLQQHISAGELMKKTITPLLGGKGGGQARFAQGTITNRENFSKLEKTLLQVLHPVPSERW